MAKGFSGQHGEAMSLPGERPRGLVERYRMSGILTTPTLPIRVAFRNALPATFILLHQGTGTPIITPQKYKGLAPSSLFPMIRQRQPWED